MRNNQMDAEFTRLFEGMIPRLDKFFYCRLKATGTHEHANLARITDNLTQQTGLKVALHIRNSPDTVGPLRKTIRANASQVWSEYLRQSKNNSHNHPPDDPSNPPNKEENPSKTGTDKDMQSPLYIQIQRINIRLIVKLIKEGYTDSQIAKKMNVPLELIQKLLLRLRKWLNRKGL